MTALRELGERRIVEIITANLTKMPRMPVPFGDDVSAISIDDKRLAVVKTDMLVGMTDVPPGMTVWQAARKAVIMNISDLSAKGVKTTAIMASVGIPNSFSESNIRELGQGLNAGAREYGAYVIGGDTSEASELIIACTAIGICLRKEVITRRGAGPGDILAVTGLFGNPAAGLKILLDRLEASGDLAERILESVYMPQARLREGLALARSKVLTASIDSSDGLAASMHQLGLMSGVGFRVENVPIAPEALRYSKMHGLDPSELALCGGEEYELVLTIKPKLWNRAVNAVKGVGGDLKPIGIATKSKQIVLVREGKEQKIPFCGWEHFKRPR